MIPGNCTWQKNHSDCIQALWWSNSAGEHLVTQLLELIHGGWRQQVRSDRQRLPQFDVGRPQTRHDVPQLDGALDLHEQVPHC